MNNKLRYCLNCSQDKYPFKKLKMNITNWTHKGHDKRLIQLKCPKCGREVYTIGTKKELELRDALNV